MWYIRKYVPAFTVVKKLGDGSCYHYTQHIYAILTDGMLKGVHPNPNMDCSQHGTTSIPATKHPGILFGYDKYTDATEEGFNCDIVKIEYSKAIMVEHVQEALLGAPPTIVVVTTDITSWHVVTDADN
jgi:hypothetical protein